MKILIVDDEELARIELRRLLSQHAGTEIVGDAADVRTALALTAAHRPDLVLLDIRLAGESGFDYAGGVTEPVPRIVFVTAHDRYALRAFECNALDYLLKPVHPERLAETLRRAHVREPAPPPQPAGEDDAVFVKTGTAACLIPWRDILVIAADGNYTSLRLADGGDLTVLRTLREWAALAPPGLFLQAHRSFLVRRAAIRELRQTGEKKHELQLHGGLTAPVGRGYASELRAALSQK